MFVFKNKSTKLNMQRMVRRGVKWVEKHVTGVWEMKRFFEVQKEQNFNG